MRKMERFRWLAGLIAAHPDRKLVGRTRLQKEMWLLQRLGMPSDYDFRMHYFGPYSEGIQADINLLNRFQLIDVVEESTQQESGFRSVFVASDSSELGELSSYQPKIDKLAIADPIVLELAATYDMCRKAGLNHEAAVVFLKEKKREKCFDGREEQALELLRELGLPAQ